MRISEKSHTDHGLTEDHLAFLQSVTKGEKSFFVKTYEMPAHLAPLLCGLYGPRVGDEAIAEEKVTYGIRGNRKCATRFIDAPARETRYVTVIAGPDGEVKDDVVLYTAYGGPQAPREPGDTSIGSWEELEEARDFWRVHALAKP